MTLAQVLDKIRQHLSRMFSYRRQVRRVAYYLNAYSIGLLQDCYSERPEAGPQNLDLKLERQQQGGPFEPYDVALVNRAAFQLLRDEKSILEVGCGTAMFSHLAAEDPRRTLTATEHDEQTLLWSMQNRSRENIHYSDKALSEFHADEFDMVVAIEVVEHLSDYSTFLTEVATIAPRAIITTPNKNRNPFDSVANTPAYGGHVREWTSGEFYWVLRAFYSDVEMYTIRRFSAVIEKFRVDDNFTPVLARCSVLEHSEPLLALCKQPIRRHPSADAKVDP